jgi:hypothetical protein
MQTTKTVHRGRTAMLSVGVGVAGAGAAIMAAFRSDMRAARSRLAGQSRLAETACGPVEMAESGSGPPALLVHGMAGGFDMGPAGGPGVPRRPGDQRGAPPWMTSGHPHQTESRERSWGTGSRSSMGLTADVPAHLRWPAST